MAFAPSSASITRKLSPTFATPIGPYALWVSQTISCRRNSTNFPTSFTPSICSKFFGVSVPVAFLGNPSPPSLLLVGNGHDRYFDIREGIPVALSVVVPNTSAADLTSAYSSAGIKYAKLTGDAAYSQTGYAVTPGTFSFTNTIVTVQSVNTAAATYYPWYDASNKTIHFLIAGNATASEVATGTNLSAVSLDVAVFGW